MLVVLAGSQDEAAAALAARWNSHETCVLTPEDLSVSGWSYEVRAPSQSLAVIGGRKVAAKEISGVLTRLPWVAEHDLGHFVPEDRAYAASEKTAFLLAWLSGLDCPVLNRPTPGCLSGPCWRAEQWVCLAARLGMRVSPVRRRAPDDDAVLAQTPSAEVVVIGNRCVGDVHPYLADCAGSLAKAAGVDLLLVSFDGAERGSKFLNASPWPDLWANDVSDAILDYFQRRMKC